MPDTEVENNNFTREALFKSERKLQQAISAAHMGTWEWDMVTNTVIWSEGVEQIFGMESGTFSGSFEAYQKLIHPEDSPKIEEAIANTIKHDTPYEVEHRIIWPDSTLHWLLGKGEVIRNSEDTPIAMHGIVMDITKEKQYEQELKTHQQELEKLVAERTAEVNEQALIINHFSDPVFTLDMQECITSWNHAAENMFGLSNQEAIHQHISILFPENIKKDFKEKIIQPVLNNSFFSIETTLHNKNDEKFFAEISLSIYTDEDSQKSGIICQFKEITKRKLAEKELRKSESNWRSLTENSSDHIVTLDKNLKIQFANFAAPGLTVDELIGKEIFKFEPTEDIQNRTKARLETVLNSGELESYESEYLLPDGSLIYYESKAAPRYIDRKIVGLTLNVRDISARKIAELKVDKQRHELEVANKELEAFSYTVSHDLRAPLRAINGMCTILLEDYSEILEGEPSELFERIKTNTHHMSSLLDGLLQLSNLSRSNFNAASVNMTELSKKIIDKLDKSEPDRSVKISVHNDMNVTADKNMLQIALENLLENAWKYTSKCNNAEIEIGQTNENGKVTYFIKDNGAGFDPRYAEKIFHVFHRLHKQTDFEGTGVGLATVSRIIHRHGGDIRFEAELNKGATFYFTLASDR